MSNIGKIIFKREIEQISKEIKSIERIDKVNSKLRKFNWVFIHPYNQGFEIKFFERLVNNDNVENIEELIFERFAKKFLDLKLTITILEGFYKKRQFMKSFSGQIEESIILCLQKDFAGAITL